MRTRARACAAILALTAAAAQAAEPAAEVQADVPANDLGLDASLAGSAQRFGVMLELKTHLRHRLYASADEAFSDNYLGLALDTQLGGPVFIHSGAQVDFAPASFAKVSAGYQVVGYFGALGTLRTMTGCHGAGALPATDLACNYQPETADGPGLGGLGHRAFVEAVLQAKVSRLLVIGGARFERWWMQPLADPAGNDFWVNEFYGLPQARADNVITGGGAVLFEAVTDAPGRPQLLVGAASDVSYAYAADVVHHRVGPVGILRIPKWKGLREVTLSAAVQFYTHERYLVGKVPFIGLALGGSTANLLGAR